MSENVHSPDADVASTPPVNSAEFWKRPERVAASGDPDTATAQTIRIMCQHVQTSASDATLKDVAHGAAEQFAGISAVDGPHALAASAFWWCKHFVKFVHHDFIIRQRLGESGHQQGLISPDVLVQMDSPEGDCAIFSECVCAFLRVFGIPYEFVTVAVNPQEPDIFSHVYVYAVMPDGSRLPLDASHGPYPGWQVPSSDVSRRQVWDASGQPVSDRGSRFDGLHNYGMRGLGDTADYSEGGNYVPPNYDNPTQEFGTFTSNDPAGSGWGGGSSGSGFNWGGLFSNLANQWTQIGAKVIAPTTTLVRGPNGQLMYSSPAGSSSPSILPSLSSSSSMPWIIGIGAALLIGAVAMGKR